MLQRRYPKYRQTNPDCPECGEPCIIIERDSAFDYAGTHVTHGRGGTHYPSDHGLPVSDCCDAVIEDAETN